MKSVSDFVSKVLLKGLHQVLNRDENSPLRLYLFQFFNNLILSLLEVHLSRKVGKYCLYKYFLTVYLEYSLVVGD